MLCHIIKVWNLKGLQHQVAKVQNQKIWVCGKGSIQLQRDWVYLWHFELWNLDLVEFIVIIPFRLQRYRIRKLKYEESNHLKKEFFLKNRLYFKKTNSFQLFHSFIKTWKLKKLFKFGKNMTKALTLHLSTFDWGLFTFTPLYSRLNFLNFTQTKF